MLKVERNRANDNEPDEEGRLHPETILYEKVKVSGMRLGGINHLETGGA